MTGSDKILLRGFGLIGIIIVAAVIAALAGGGFYYREVKNQQNLQQIGNQKVKEAEDLKRRVENQNVLLLDEVNNLNTPDARSLRSVQERASGIKNQLESE